MKVYFFYINAFEKENPEAYKIFNEVTYGGEGSRDLFDFTEKFERHKINANTVMVSVKEKNQARRAVSREDHQDPCAQGGL